MTETIQFLKDLLERVHDHCINCGTDYSIKNDYRKELKRIRGQIQKLENIIREESIHVRNADSLTEKTLSLVKDILESQLYRDYTDYDSKLKISKKFAKKLEGDTGEVGLHNIRTQFYLDAKKNERDFRETQLKGLAREMEKRVDKVNKRSEKRYTKVKNKVCEQTESIENNKKELNKKISQHIESTKNNIEELKNEIFEMFKQIGKENKSKLEEIYKKIDEEKKELKESKDFNNQKYEDFEKENKELKRQNKELSNTLDELKK